jgi:predicted metallo-beta-lactamase superfamily hydrolase
MAREKIPLKKNFTTENTEIFMLFKNHPTPQINLTQRRKERKASTHPKKIHQTTDYADYHKIFYCFV